MAQLEAERSALKMRSTSAEEQLAELQGAMASNILRYQKEILRLRQQLHESQGHMQTFLQVTVQKQLSDISRSVTESQRTLHADMVCLQREYVPKAEFKDLALRNDQLLTNQAGMEKKIAELENQVHSAQGKIKTLEEENMKQQKEDEEDET